MILNEIWQKVQANHKRLRECSRHDFRPVDPSSTVIREYRCLYCEGTIDNIKYHWYMQGQLHALRGVKEKLK